MEYDLYQELENIFIKGQIVSILVLQTTWSLELLLSSIVGVKAATYNM